MSKRKDGEILFFWSPVAETNPLDYYDDGYSLFIFLADSMAVYRLTGFI